MPRQNRVADGLIPGSCKIRKRGCSSSSSTSSVLQNYRFKRAILVGKARGSRSRSNTPVPTWRTTAAGLRREAAEATKYTPSQSGGGRSRPVSARKLAATLWEMNEVPSPRVGEEEEEEEKRPVKKEAKVRERMGAPRSVYSAHLPPHLSDPSHSPVSERMDRSGTGSHHRRTSSISHRLRLADHNVGVLDTRSSASLMEVETRSRVQTPSGSVVGGRTRLKDVSNALTTSKELLKIINRMWARDDQPSSSLSLISALHAELERARLQVNQLIHEQRSEQDDINYLIKRFAEEKAAWKNKEQKAVEAAIESLAGELEVERKMRRRMEGLNKKLGKELAETNTSLIKAVKELEGEKRSREIMGQVCDNLARDIGEDKAKFEATQMKLSEAKHQFEDKSSVVDKLRNHLEVLMRTKRGNKQKGSRSPGHNNTDDNIAAYLSRSRTCFGAHQDDIQEDDGEVEDGVDCEDDHLDGSDIHSIELNMDNNNKSYKWKNDSPRVLNEDGINGRNFTTGRASRRSTSFQRSMSDGVEFGVQSESIQNYSKLEKQAERKSCGDYMQGYKSIKSLRDQILATSRGSGREFASPTREWGQSWLFQEKNSMVQGSSLKPRLAECRGEGQTARRSKR